MTGRWLSRQCSWVHEGEQSQVGFGSGEEVDEQRYNVKKVVRGLAGGTAERGGGKLVSGERRRWRSSPRTERRELQRRLVPGRWRLRGSSMQRSWWWQACSSLRPQSTTAIGRRWWTVPALEVPVER
ncbi:hypothetical protein E2562_006525 [Oryza meyeriana var. granulata]|uniref:Uncharacterized protein n=1 Tax=Oryza meyeriana var. granulata TaxID=110450 RepID=A0A6G1BTG5_9ORYZ|nr:hypothetical protein E2562_006525 [Oryza meyeriana var. granulata]